MLQNSWNDDMKSRRQEGWNYLNLSQLNGNEIDGQSDVMVMNHGRADSPLIDNRKYDLSEEIKLLYHYEHNAEHDDQAVENDLQDTFQDFEGMLDEYLSIKKLQSATGESDLSKVEYLELIVNTTENTLGDLGGKAPNLIHLRLSNSTIPSIRDLGTSMRNLTVLWMSRCSLREIEGIGALPNLTELYVPFNDIDDISSLSSLEQLQILDLEGNSIADFDQMQYLVDCPKLHSLTLEGNEIAMADHFRRSISIVLPQLEFLDDVRLSDEHRSTPNSSLSQSSYSPSPSSTPDSMKREIDMVKSAIKYSSVAELHHDDLIEEPVIVTATPRSRLKSSSIDLSRRPVSAAAILTSRPSSAMTRPKTAASSFIAQCQMNRISKNGAWTSRPMTSRLNTSRPRTTSLDGRSGSSTGPFYNHNLSDEEERTDSSSSLTYGSKEVICGNPVKGLRKRRKDAGEDELLITDPKKLTIDPNYGSMDDILEEIRAEKKRQMESLEWDPSWMSDSSDDDCDSNEKEVTSQDRSTTKITEAKSEAIRRLNDHLYVPTAPTTSDTNRRDSATHHTTSKNDDHTNHHIISARVIPPGRLRPVRKNSLVFTS